MGGQTQEYKCQCCGNSFSARVADRKRGWARFCSKSCKAIRQEKRTGQMKTYLRDKYYREEYGGTPCYGPSGEYVGFLSGPFDNTSCQNE